MFGLFIPSKFRSNLILVSSIFVLQILSLLQTDQPRFFCGPVINQFHFLNLTFLCDSSHYLLTADSPEKLLYFSIDPQSFGSPLQDRPLAPILAHSLSRILNLFTPLDVKFLYSGLDNISNSYSLTVYLAYLILNSIILLVTVVVALKLIRSKLFGLRFFILVFLSFNQLTQNYFWLPNTVLMNNLFAVLLVMYIKYHRFLNSKQHYLLMGSFIILAQYYPIFLFGLVIFALVNIYSQRWNLAVLSFISSMITFFIPMLVINLIGIYKNNPINSGYFAWANISKSPEFRVNEFFTSIVSFYNSFSILHIFICLVLVFSKTLLREFKYVALIYIVYLFSIGVYDYRYNVGFVSFLTIAFFSNAEISVNKKNNLIAIFVTLAYLLIAFFSVGKTY
jgi:hypothetical protein